jgi:hypothetical protein
MVRNIRTTASEFGDGMIDSNELRERLREISADPPDNEHNLGKAFRAGLVMDSDCSDERLSTAREIVQEVDSEIYSGVDSPYNNAFGVSPKDSE